MNQSNLYIHGMGHFHPENSLDNQFLQDLDIGTNNEWILERVGIKKRRTVLDLDYLRRTKNSDPKKSPAASVYTNVQMGVRAAKMALKRAGLKTSDIGMVVAGGCSAEYSIPAEACIVASELGIQAPAYDLNSACSSFAFHMHYLRSMMDEALPDYILSINTEGFTRCIDYSDRKSAVLFGDASAATIVSKSKPSTFNILDSNVTSEPKGWEKIIIPTKDFFVQDGSHVQMFAIRKTMSALKKLKEKCTVKPEKLYFIGHQANLLVLENVVEKMEISKDRHLYNVDEYGNCGASGAPSVISQNWDLFKPGDEIAVCVVGSGLSWGGLLIQRTV